ncbi:MAG: hypothetical protein GY810_13795 [Aureispira sp.]|nr:hypothetical protein [Aureispira sp.]
MESTPPKQSKIIKNVQDWLSLGYLYLLLLGIGKDAIFYSFFDINILNYASLLDVVLSPITLLIERKVILILIITIIIVLALFPFTHRKLREKTWYKKRFDVDKLDKRYINTPLVNQIAPILALALFSAYIGYGVGSGEKVSSIIASGDFELRHEISFSDGTNQKVRIVGQNSQYLFYALEGDTEISISPILSNIKKIEKLAKPQKKTSKSKD